MVNWYDTFNVIESGLWGVVALAVAARVTCSNWQQRLGVALGSLGFLAFGGTDLLEVGRDGILPLWLWGLKTACGIAILAARFTWTDWNRFHWRSREFLFGAACLVAVVLVILLQQAIEPYRFETRRARPHTPRSIPDRFSLVRFSVPQAAFSGALIQSRRLHEGGQEEKILSSDFRIAVDHNDLQALRKGKRCDQQPADDSPIATHATTALTPPTGSDANSSLYTMLKARVAADSRRRMQTNVLTDVHVGWGDYDNFATVVIVPIFSIMR